ncbi:MAG TPA: alpha/beta hydrolase [Chloroflexia bacterium]|nr:alpha/beta hydrolase [Chloroflexia bacterium]
MSSQDHTLRTSNTGLELHYRTWGTEGAPPLVLVHGLASTLRIWDFVAPILAERYFVAAYDQRGHALSGKPADGYNLPTMLADLVGFLDALHIEKPVVVGHSWGANLALAYAATYPDKCAGLALVDGGIADFQDVPGTTWENVKRELAPPDLSRFKLSDMVSRMRGGVLSSLPEQFVEEYARSIMDVQPDGTIRARLTLDRHLDILHILYDMHSADLLARVTCPVLAIQAVNGEHTSEREAQFVLMKKQGAGRLEKLLPGAKIVWMENTIHDIPLQRPERLAHEILDYFADR